MNRRPMIDARAGAVCPVAVRRLALLLLATLSPETGGAWANVLERATCTKAETVRQIRLESVRGMDDVCDLIDRRKDDGSEERALFHSNGEAGFCRARFRTHVEALVDRGWACEPSSPPPARSVAAAPSPTPDDTSFETLWRERCAADLAGEHGDSRTICGCAVDVLNAAGFEERDYELLASPYEEGRLEQPIHRAGLLYGAGLMAVDALARCGVP